MKRFSLPAFLSLTASFCVGCASPGPPKPPSLHLPQLVKDLSAERIGDHVLLRWTTPSRTTDDMEIKGAMTAELCRESDTRPATPAARLAACAPVRRLPVVPGQSEVTDILPAPLQADPVMLLTYRIQIFNATGHSAGESTVAAYAAAGHAPAPITSLHAAASEQGAILEWHTAAAQGATTSNLVDLKRTDLSAPPAEKKAKPATVQTPKKSKSSPTRKSAEETSNEIHLRAADAAATPNAATVGTVDTTAAMGDTYTYTAQRVRAVSLAGHHLEIQSDPSPTITLAMRDTVPPRVPTGLATISGNASTGANAAPYIDLSWEPNSESDLAGYRVYRQLARPDGSPQGPLGRLTAVPIPVPAYRDVAVAAGQGYIYSVTAVDAAGNESAPSAKALENVTPDGGEPPH